MGKICYNNLSLVCAFGADKLELKKSLRILSKNILTYKPAVINTAVAVATDKGLRLLVYVITIFIEVITNE